MFPYSSNPYPSFPSSSSSPFLPFPFLNPENASATNNTLFHDPFSVPYIPTHHHNTNPIPETLTNLVDNCAASAAAMPKQDPSGGGAHYGISCLLTKKPAKKDRHSKIYTSQGLRDRRVRLSIEIARKFFDLQDMLGFDKASNTLEWLFNKSKKAIKELAKSKNSNNSDGSSSSECEDCEVVSGMKQQHEALIADTPNLLQQQQQQQQQGLDSNDKSFICDAAGKERKLKRAQKEPACVRAKMKESREKARARARERTSNKMCNTTGRVQQDHMKKKYPASENHQIIHHLEDCARSSPPNKLVHPHPHPHHHHHHLVGGSETPRDDFNVIEESIVIKRKLKPSLMSSSSSHHHHHQNIAIPKEASFNNDFHSFPNMSPNWDASNGAATARSNFCAIASMNLSTGLQIFGKSWEECTNPRLH